MSISEQLHHVRDVVKKSLSEIGTAIVDSCLETVLMKDDFYSGHRFRYKELIAEWFLDADEIVIKSVDGEVLTVVSLNSEGALKKAA